MFNRLMNAVIGGPNFTVCSNGQNSSVPQWEWEIELGVKCRLALPHPLYDSPLTLYGKFKDAWPYMARGLMNGRGVST